MMNRRRFVRDSAVLAGSAVLLGGGVGGGGLPIGGSRAAGQEPGRLGRRRRHAHRPRLQSRGRPPGLRGRAQGADGREDPRQRLVVARLPGRRRRHQDQLHRRAAHLLVPRLDQRDDRRPQGRRGQGEQHRHLGPDGPRLPPHGPRDQPRPDRRPGHGLLARLGGRRALGPGLRPEGLRLVRGRDAQEVPRARRPRLHPGGLAPRDLQLRLVALDPRPAGQREGQEVRGRAPPALHGLRGPRGDQEDRRGGRQRVRRRRRSRTRTGPASPTS